MKHVYIIFIILFGLLLSGCVNPTQEPTDYKTSTDDVNWEIPSPAEGTGLIKGFLIGNDSEISVGGTPFLSKNLSFGQAEIPPTISFSPSSDIRAQVNEITGAFYFQNVPPADNYVIAILDGPGEIYIVRKDNSEAPLEIQIKAGEVIDLGKILVEERK
jgi:hypothetical protein